MPHEYGCGVGWIHYDLSTSCMVLTMSTPMLHTFCHNTSQIQCFDFKQKTMVRCHQQSWFSAHFLRGQTSIWWLKHICSCNTKNPTKKKDMHSFLYKMSMKETKHSFINFKKTHLIEIQRPLKSHLDEGGWSQWRTDSACRIAIDSPTGEVSMQFSQKWTWDVEICDPE